MSLSQFSDSSTPPFLEKDARLDHQGVIPITVKQVSTTASQAKCSAASRGFDEILRAGKDKQVLGSARERRGPCCHKRTIAG